MASKAASVKDKAIHRVIFHVKGFFQIFFWNSLDLLLNCSSHSPCFSILSCSGAIEMSDNLFQRSTRHNFDLKVHLSLPKSHSGTGTETLTEIRPVCPSEILVYTSPKLKKKKAKSKVSAVRGALVHLLVEVLVDFPLVWESQHAADNAGVFGRPSQVADLRPAVLVLHLHHPLDDGQLLFRHGNHGPEPHLLHLVLIDMCLHGGCIFNGSGIQNFNISHKRWITSIMK